MTVRKLGVLMCASLVLVVVGLIGIGGMGEVYRTRDTKLDRDVALKVLPDLFADDPERLAQPLMLRVDTRRS